MINPTAIIPQGNLAFSTYVKQAASLIETRRKAANFPHSETVVKMNSPFERRPEGFNGQRAVLLIHGFLTCPYILRGIGETFVQQGFLVRSILLPGHGTIPGDLCTATLEQWQATVDYGIRSLQKEAKEIHLCGYSLGATLACLAAYRHPIKSLTLLSPAFGITPWVKVLAPLVQLHKTRLFPLGRWVSTTTENDDATYHSVATRGAHEVARAIQLLQQQLRQQPQTLPCFIVASVDDATVRIKPILRYFSQNANPESWMRLYARDIKGYQGKKMEVIPSLLIDTHVVDISHIAIPVSPIDPYYGAHGHYLKDWPKDVWMGELTRRNVHKHQPFRRLTYNPDFRGMTERLQQFLAR